MRIELKGTIYKELSHLTNFLSSDSDKAAALYSEISKYAVPLVGALLAIAANESSGAPQIVRADLIPEGQYLVLDAEASDFEGDMLNLCASVNDFGEYCANPIGGGFFPGHQRLWLKRRMPYDGGCVMARVSARDQAKNLTQRRISHNCPPFHTEPLKPIPPKEEIPIPPPIPSF